MRVDPFKDNPIELKHGPGQSSAGDKRREREKLMSNRFGRVTAKNIGASQQTWPAMAAPAAFDQAAFQNSREA